MKIPKYILNLLRMRRTYAEKLNECDLKLMNWLDAKGIDYISELQDHVNTGCCMYCEPASSELTIIHFLENYEQERER